MTFTNIFGEVLDKNPNLVELNFTAEQKDFICQELLKSPYTEDEKMYLAEPVYRKLESDCKELLRAEINFIKSVLQLNMSQSYRSSNKSIYENCLLNIEQMLRKDA